MTEVENFLEHYGVRGMQWGVRTKSRRKSQPASDDHKKAKDLLKKPRSSLSNQELKALNERRNLEQNHARLNPSVVRRGESHVRGLVGAVGLATSVATLHNTPFGRAIINGGQRFVDRMTSMGLNDIRLTD